MESVSTSQKVSLVIKTAFSPSELPIKYTENNSVSEGDSEKNLSLEDYPTMHQILEKPENSESVDESISTRDCEKDFSHEDSPTTHQAEHSAGEAFVCDKCGKSFRLKKYLARHKTFFSCEEYGRDSSPHSSLAYHKRTHSREKPFTCSVCAKDFCYSYHLMNHMKQHMSTKPFKCDIDGKCFGTNQTLKNHKRIHTDERPYVGDVCNDYLSYHKKSSHGGKKPFSCSMCGKGFLYFYHLDRHRRQHSNAMFSCESSGQFGNKSSLLKHKKSHLGKIVFCCHVCGVHFKYSSHLLRHMKSVHHCDSLDCSNQDDDDVLQHGSALGGEEIVFVANGLSAGVPDYVTNSSQEDGVPDRLTDLSQENEGKGIISNVEVNLNEFSRDPLKGGLVIKKTEILKELSMKNKANTLGEPSVKMETETFGEQSVNKEADILGEHISVKNEVVDTVEDSELSIKEEMDLFDEL